MTNGEKPYMTYTRYGGEGNVQQNVAIAGFSAEQYEECRTSILVDCERIKPLSTIEQLEFEMMYKDKECCNDGHRDTYSIAPYACEHWDRLRPYYLRS